MRIRKNILKEICPAEKFCRLLAAAGLLMLASAASDGGAVLLTSIIGVGVVAWPQRTEAGAAVTLWSDPSYGHYFWSTLLEVGRSAGSVSIKGSET